MRVTAFSSPAGINPDWLLSRVGLSASVLGIRTGLAAISPRRLLFRRRRGLFGGGVAACLAFAYRGQLLFQPPLLFVVHGRGGAGRRHVVHGWILVRRRRPAPPRP